MTNTQNLALRARAIEVVFDEHISGADLIKHYRENIKHGLYKAFVKWHNGNEDDDDEADGESHPHTHVALILREKPRYEFDKLKSIFAFGTTEPKLVNPLGRGNLSPLKKLTQYVKYLTDGHDNGHFNDSWHYKFDYELESCKNDAKILVLLSRGKTIREIINESDWNFRAYYMKNKAVLDKMVSNWRMSKEDATVYHELDEFRQEVVEETLKDFDPKKQSLILKGPTDMGKTEFSKAIIKYITKKNPLFCSNLNKLVHREWGQGIIFDDMNFKEIRRSKAIALTDVANDRDIRVLFGIHTINAGTPRIFTTNEEIEDYLPYDEHGAIDRRIKIVDLTKFGRLF